MNNALATFDPSKPAQKLAACNALTAFVSALQTAQALRLVPAATAADLIADAARIRTVLAC